MIKYENTKSERNSDIKSKIAVFNPDIFNIRS